ncbi:MAG TPA: dienelactone hydrolase family protein [Thermoplasmata archaeon]|nr:dienelactone hydrolase family protein [Thermoplasmata archaeon]
MRDDDRLLDLPDPEYGSGVIGVCDICGERQAVIVLSRERFKLCVLDFLNKTWLKTDKKPGAPLPSYRSERVWFDSVVSSTGKASAIVLSPTKVVRHPIVLVTPDVYGLTTTVLDAAIRFAREGCEVMLPDVAKTDGIGAAHHLTLRSSAQFRGGVAADAKRVTELVGLYTDALEFLRHREMVDPTKSALFGASYGGSLATLLAARETRLGALVVAYPMPIKPDGIPSLVSAPVLFLAGDADRAAAKARRQFEAARGPNVAYVTLPGARHHFLSRDLGAYDLAQAERAWSAAVGFVKQQLMPPPPRPPPPPVRPPDAAPPTAPRPAAPGTPPPPRPATTAAPR